MQDIAGDSCKECAVGATGWMRPDPSNGIDLEAFQAVEIAADIMQDEGQIHIVEKHRESQTGRRLIDAIKFVRMM